MQRNLECPVNVPTLTRDEGERELLCTHPLVEIFPPKSYALWECPGPNQLGPVSAVFVAPQSLAPLSAAIFQKGAGVFTATHRKANILAPWGVRPRCPERQVGFVHRCPSVAAQTPGGDTIPTVSEGASLLLPGPSCTGCTLPAARNDVSQCQRLVKGKELFIPRLYILRVMT